MKNHSPTRNLPRPSPAPARSLPEPTAIPPALIGFDIDGVVADTMEAFIRIAREDYRLEVRPEEITAFQVEDCLDLEPAVVAEIFGRLLEAPLAAGLRLMPYAGRVLREFARLAPLTFITARPKREPIRRWLRVMLGETAFRSTRLIATGEHDGKADYIKDLGLRYFVDDRAQTCLALRREGINAIVYRQPWNQGQHQLATVDDWLAIRRLCLPPEPSPAQRSLHAQTA